MKINLQKTICLFSLCFFLFTFSSYCQIISTYAGNYRLGVGFSGDGGPASKSQLNNPAGVVIDKFGNVFFADEQNNRIRKVDVATGIISTYAGNGISGYTGDNGLATSAELNYPTGLALDTLGNLYIADVSYAVRKVDVNSHLITTVAGNGIKGYSGDGGPAIDAELNFAQGVFVDKYGNIYILDCNNNRIRKVDAKTHIISTYAGDGIAGFKGDGGAATLAEFNQANSITGDTLGNIYITDTYNFRIRKIDKSSGIISTIAGNGLSGYTGDNGPAASAEINDPLSITVSTSGDIFIGDQNAVVRKIEASNGYIYTVAGNGAFGFSGDGASALLAQLSYPTGVAVDAMGDIFISDVNNNRVRKVDAITHYISTFAGDYTAFGGDGGPVVSAVFNLPKDIAFDRKGNLYIADGLNNRIRKVDAATKIITTIIGDGTGQASAKDSIPRGSAKVGFPLSVATDSAGNVYYADESTWQVRKLSIADNVVYTVAGTGASSHLGPYTDNNNKPAKDAFFSYVQGIKLDAKGNIYFVDLIASIVYKVDVQTQLINIIAGTGIWGSSGNGGPASQALLNFPTDIALDKAGNIYIADGNNTIRKVDAVTHIITSFAGNGQSGYAGDGGLASAATIGSVTNMNIDSAGNILLSCNNNVVRRIDAVTNIITTIAGTGVQGYSGDNGPASKAEIAGPAGLDFDKTGNMFFIDEGNEVIRKITAATLPVLLQSFTATKSGKGSLLDWQTASEINSAFFQIERMGEQGGFTGIGKVAAAGNSIQTQKYSFEDGSPLQGINYYRLKQVDKDGKFAYSNIESVDFSLPISLKLYPNPAQNSLVIQGLDNQTKTNISIIDLSGKIINNVSVTAGECTLNVKQLLPGNYYLLLKTNSKISTLKFIKGK